MREGAPVPVNETSCKSQYPPIRVLDTTTYTWKTSFDETLKYNVPSAVTAIIGGDGQGGANVMAPQGGFNFTDLNTIFSQTLGATKTNGSSLPVPPGPSQKSNTGAIVGGVIAGVAGLAIIVGIAYYFIRRKRKASEKRGNGWGSTESPGSGEQKRPLVTEGGQGDGGGMELPAYSRPAELGENHRGGGPKSPVELSG